MNNIDPALVTYVIGVGGAVFGIYSYFRNPQIKSEKVEITFRGEIDSIKAEIKEIKETHLRSLEAELKSLNSNVNELAKTVVRLATIIDERIPKK